MKTQSFYDFFYLFSKAIIVFSLVVVIFGLVLKFNQKQENLLFDKSISPTKIIFSPTPKNFPLKFDLQGPWQCLFYNPQATVTAYIKNRKVKVEIKNNKGNSYFLIDNDCLYRWEEGQFFGDKTCGIGPYLSFAESIFKKNQLMFFDLFFKQFKEFRPENFSWEDICKKEDFEGNIFLLPTTILFKNKPLNL